MDEKQLQALANELAKNLKTPDDLNQFDRLLKKISVEAALNAEMSHHLGYDKNQPKLGANSRNGYFTKTVTTGDGPLELRTPRDRDGSFEPQLVKKNQTRITGMDNQILSLYAKGMTTREIAAAFKELYDADVSPALVSKVTDAVMEQVVEWQNRPLDAVYPIVYLDCIVLKVRQDSRVINKSVFLALGINIEGQKELLGMWLAENEGAKFWLNVLTEFEKDPYLGLLCPPFPTHGVYFMNMCSNGWGPNFDNTKALMKKLGIDRPISGEKMPIAPFGSVFWFRVKALAPLFDHGWQHEDFPPEPLPQDGTISHAIERIYPFVAQGAGYYPAQAMSADYAVARCDSMQAYASGLIRPLARVFDCTTFGRTTCHGIDIKGKIPISSRKMCGQVNLI